MSLATELHQKAQAEQAAKEQETRVEETAKRAAEFAEWERLERLWKSDDVQWLLGEFKRVVDAEHDAALDTIRPPEDADRARHRHKAVKDLAEMLEIRHTQKFNRLFGEKV